jgi:hypothetical protein
MTSCSLKQICVALCLMASLAVGHISICTCSHHERPKVVEESACHSHHQKADKVEVASDANACDSDCTCAVQQPSPVVASKSPSKDIKSSEEILEPEQIVVAVEFVAISTYRQPPSDLASGLSHLNTLKSLLPSRAPPRL